MLSQNMHDKQMWSQVHGDLCLSWSHLVAESVDTGRWSKIESNEIKRRVTQVPFPAVQRRDGRVERLPFSAGGGSVHLIYCDGTWKRMAPLKTSIEDRFEDLLALGNIFPITTAASWKEATSPVQTQLLRRIDRGKGWSGTGRNGHLCGNVT